MIRAMEHWLRGGDTAFCPGCGHGILLGAILRAVDELKLDPRNSFVSGIGCAAWIPSPNIKADTLHTLHGRAVAYATGAKLVQPDLTVMVVSGDGDLSSIGGNHLIHAARRDLDLNVVCANNQIYGMTGGQTAPTTPMGGQRDHRDGNRYPSLRPVRLVRAAGAGFAARGSVPQPRQLIDQIGKALRRPGSPSWRPSRRAPPSSAGATGSTRRRRPWTRCGATARTGWRSAKRGRARWTCCSWGSTPMATHRARHPLRRTRRPGRRARGPRPWSSRRGGRPVRVRCQQLRRAGTRVGRPGRDAPLGRAHRLPSHGRRRPPVASSQDGYETCKDRVTEGGLVLYDSGLVKTADSGLKHLGFDVAAVARDELHSAQVANVIWVGVVAVATGWLGDDALREAIRLRVPERFLEA